MKIFYVLDSVLFCLDRRIVTGLSQTLRDAGTNWVPLKNSDKESDKSGHCSIGKVDKELGFVDVICRLTGKSR